MKDTTKMHPDLFKGVWLLIDAGDKDSFWSRQAPHFYPGLDVAVREFKKIKEENGLTDIFASIIATWHPNGALVTFENPQDLFAYIEEEDNADV